MEHDSSEEGSKFHKHQSVAFMRYGINNVKNITIFGYDKGSTWKHQNWEYNKEKSHGKSKKQLMRGCCVGTDNGNVYKFQLFLLFYNCQWSVVCRFSNICIAKPT